MNENQYPSSLEDLIIVTKDLLTAERFILSNIGNGFAVSNLSVCSSLAIVAERYAEQILEKIEELNLSA